MYYGGCYNRGCGCIMVVVTIGVVDALWWLLQ